MKIYDNFVEKVLEPVVDYFHDLKGENKFEFLRYKDFSFDINEKNLPDVSKHNDVHHVLEFLNCLKKGTDGEGGIRFDKNSLFDKIPEFYFCSISHKSKDKYCFCFMKGNGDDLFNYSVCFNTDKLKVLTSDGDYFITDKIIFKNKNTEIVLGEKNE